MDVGVHELKQHLAEYLERAAQGEVIRVTDSGQPRVIISPASSVQATLRTGIEEGWVRAADTDAPKPARRARAQHSTLQVLTEDRGT